MVVCLAMRSSTVGQRIWLGIIRGMKHALVGIVPTIGFKHAILAKQFTCCARIEKRWPELVNGVGIDQPSFLRHTSSILV